MTAPGGTGYPILDELAMKAAALGVVDISAQLIKAQEIMDTDPATMRAGNERLAAIKGGLDATQQGLQQAGTEAANGWTGMSADAFGTRMSELTGGLANSGAVVTQISGQLTAAADAFDGARNVVETITPATLAALRVMGM